LLGVLFVPKLSTNLVSVTPLTSSGFVVAFSSSSCTVQDPCIGQVIGISHKVGNLYQLKHLHVPAFCVATTSTIVPRVLLLTSADLWHYRLGHPLNSRLFNLFKMDLLKRNDSSSVSPCKSCKLAKHLAIPFNTRKSSSLATFDLIHSDIWGPVPISSLGGYFYYVCFVDDYSRYTWIYLMRQRSSSSYI